jgi:hypothetical protein
MVLSVSGEPTSTIKIISCLKSWGLFKDELEEVKREEQKKEKKDSEEGNLFFYRREVVFK